MLCAFLFSALGLLVQELGVYGLGSKGFDVERRIKRA